MLRAAFLLALISSPALAMPVPTCAEIRDVAKQYTPAQIREMAKRAKLTAEQWAAIKKCLDAK